MAAGGVSIRRGDGMEKVAGQALYAGDFSLPGMAHARVLRSPLPHARIRRIDVSKATALAGVFAVLTRDNLRVASNSFGVYVKDQQILATDKGRYVGDMIAPVAAMAGSASQEAAKRNNRHNEKTHAGADSE